MTVTCSAKLDPNKQTILLVSSGYHLYREYLLKQISNAANVVLLLDREPTWERPYIVQHHYVDTLDTEQLIRVGREVMRHIPIQGAVCWDEVRMVKTAELAEALALPGSSVIAATQCRDKRKTREALAAAGVPQPRSICVCSYDEALVAARSIGFPVVVKPRALGASIGVSLAADEAELAAAFRDARAAFEDGVPHYQEGVLIEEYVDGPEISVDTAWHEGELIPLFVARKITGFPPHFEEVGHVVDSADPLLYDPALRRVLEQAHRAVGFRSGITHTELRLTPSTPKIIEINGRLGGDFIPFVGWVASGIDPGQVAVEIACGKSPLMAASSGEVAAVHFLYPDEDATVAEVRIDVALLPPGVVKAVPLAQPGQRLVLPPAGHVTSRYAYFVVAGKSAAECEATAALAKRAFKLCVRKENPKPQLKEEGVSL